jgi:hypothetical protein
MQPREGEQDVALERLRKAMEVQRTYLSGYEKPSELIAYETLRTLDDLFLRDLMEPERLVDTIDRQFRDISTWGVNHALSRIVPKTPVSRPFRDFPSQPTIQAKADDFVFNCATLGLSERFEGWLREGILVGEHRPEPKLDRDGIGEIILLRSVAPSYSDEEIGLAGRRWAGEQTLAEDRSLELVLEERFRKLERALERRVDLVDGWRMIYESTKEIDDHFLEWGQFYLRRKFSQDMIASSDVIGGRPFSRYTAVLSVLSGRCQKHIAFAAILRVRYPSVHIRNLLTSHSDREWFIESLARYLDADRGEIESILASLTLNGDNLEVHTRSGELAWAPIVQASTDTLILPAYGLDINPFLFLLTDLRYRYEKDWFRVANNRERRWIEELEGMFVEPRWQTHGRNLRLREGGKDLTDIDFVLYDRKANELALFQLKWQHPVGIDNRGRRSAGKNLVEESNRWIDIVISWLGQHGVGDVLRRLGFDSSTSPRVHLFVLGRYHVHLSGFDARDRRAIWSDWAHFCRACEEEPRTSNIEQIASRLQSTVEESRAMKSGESLMFPVGDLAVLLNPKSVPVDK